MMLYMKDKGWTLFDSNRWEYMPRIIFFHTIRRAMFKEYFHYYLICVYDTRHYAKLLLNDSADMYWRPLPFQKLKLENGKGTA